MNTAEQNYRLLQEIDANRRFMLMAYQQNPKLLEQAEARIRQWFEGQAHRQIEERTGFSSPHVPQSAFRSVAVAASASGTARPTPCGCTPPVCRAGTGRQSGASLIELIMFIVIVSAALAGILLVMNVTTKGSADPLIRKQAIAAAYSLLEEVELQDFSNPPGGFTPATPGTPVQAERTSFDDVGDYNGFKTTGIYSLADAASASAVLANYNASVAVVPETAVWNGIAAGSAVQINVTVNGPNGEAITATGYRAAY